jgi:hypothetical protein
MRGVFIYQASMESPDWDIFDFGSKQSETSGKAGAFRL